MSRLFVLLALALASYTNSAQAADAVGTYGLHLFFNEKEAIDVLKIARTSDGKLTGEMHVPDDFDAVVLEVTEKEGVLSFDLPVPKNSSRPVDLMFHYEGKFFDAAHDQLAGFVTLKGEKDFVASFVAFRRAQ